MANDYQTFRVMAKFGGSFARAIAEAAQRADPQNLARLKSAFPELIQEYGEMAELIEKRALDKARGL